jgi:curved DNA-binding protein CbpA
MLPDYYAILGIRSDASPDEVRASYRRLARRHHPDVGGESSAFQALQEAYEELSDPARRRAYDASLRSHTTAVRVRMPARSSASNDPEPLIPDYPLRAAWSSGAQLGSMDDFNRLFREFDEFFERLEQQFLRPSWRRND